MSTTTDPRQFGRVVLAGYGDIGARVARRLGDSRPLLAINRSGRTARLSPPLQVTRCDLPELGPLLESADTLLWLAPPPAEGEVESHLQAVLARAPQLRKVIYLSTSGVYGDCAGAWVQESAAANPQTPRAKRRFSGETLALQYGQRREVPVAVIRVPGIYGPGRLPRARLARRLPVLAASISPWSNRIHAEDLAAALVLLLDKGEGVFNISDGSPGSITEYFQAVADVLGVPHLPEVASATELSPELASYMRESRRLDITRAREELGFSPQYPQFRQALLRCVENDLVWDA